MIVEALQTFAHSLRARFQSIWSYGQLNSSFLNDKTIGVIGPVNLFPYIYDMGK